MIAVEIIFSKGNIVADTLKQSDLETMITVAEAAELLHLTPQMVSVHCRRGNLPSKKMGGMYFLTLGSVRAFGRKERKPGPKPKSSLQKI